MEKIIAYIIAKTIELVTFTIFIAVYYNVIYPSSAVVWSRELFLAFSLVLTFSIVSLYVATSLAAHLVFQQRKGFGYFCAGAYIVATLFFLALNPVTGLENLAIFAVALPIVYSIGILAKGLARRLCERNVG